MAAKSLLANIVRKVWTLAVVMLVLVTAYVSLGRIVLPRISLYQTQIEEYLSDQLRAEVSFAELNGAWHGFQPSISFEQLKVAFRDQTQTNFLIKKVDFQFDVYTSLLKLKPVFSSFIVDGAELSFLMSEDAQWHLKGRHLEQKPKTTSLEFGLAVLLSQKNITVKNVVINLITGNQKNREEKQVAVNELMLSCVVGACSGIGEIALIDGDDQSAISLSFNAKNPGSIKDLNLAAYVDIEPIKLERWRSLVNANAPNLNRFNKVHAGGRFWVDVEKGNLDAIQANMTIPELDIIKRGGDNVQFRSIETGLLWQSLPVSNQQETAEGNDQGGGWVLWLDDLAFKLGDKEMAKTRLQVEFVKAHAELNMMADQFNLGFVNDTLLAAGFLPDKVADSLTTLDPNGTIDNIHASYVMASETDASTKPKFELEANLVGVEASPWKGAPGATGIDGYLYVTPHGGRVELKANAFSIFFPKLYSNRFRFSQAQGVVNWRNRGKAFWLDSSLLKLGDGASGLTGKFSLSQPRNGEEPRFDLLIGLEKAQARPTLSYIPDKRVSANLVSWLDQAIIAGDVNDVRVMFSGPATKESTKDAVNFQLSLNTSAAELRYLPGWPHLKGVNAQVSVLNNNAKVTADKGTVKGLALQDINVSFEASKGGLVAISSKVSGPTEDGLYLLQETPLRDSMFSLVDDFNMSGDLTANLDLAIPLAEPKQTTINLGLSTKNSTLSIPSLDIAFNGINGEFGYNTKTGINAKSVQAVFLEESVDIDIVSSPVTDKQKRQQIKINMAGKLDMAALSQWQTQPLFTKFTGVTDYNALLKLGGGEQNQLTIASDLVGVQANLPLPFHKLKDKKMPLAFTMLLADEEQQHFIRYGANFQAALAFTGQKYTEGEVELGGGEASLTRDKGVNILGSLSVLNVTEWLDFFESFSDGEKRSDSADNTRESLNRLNRGKLKVAKLEAFGQSFEDISLEVGRSKGDWWLQGENAIIKGRAYQFEDITKPLSIALDYLRLPSREDKTDVEQDPLNDVVPQDLPAFNFTTNEFSVGSENFGAWSFNFRPNKQGADIDQLSLEKGGLNASGKLVWTLQDGLHKSSFTGKAETGDIAKVLTSWGYSPSVEGKKGSLVGGFTWTASPAGYSLALLKGDVVLKAKEGRFKEVDTASNALRVFGVLNFNSIARRLRLDFSDLVKKGYSFDTVKGRLFFDEGQILIKDSLIIDGPSAKFKIDGRTDLVNKTFDQDMIVVLPLTSNLPIAAAIAGVPQVGIPLYLINKVFGKPLERFTSASYKITGPWDKPKLELITVFSKKSKSEKTSSDASSKASKPAS